MIDVRGLIDDVINYRYLSEDEMKRTREIIFQKPVERVIIQQPTEGDIFMSENPTTSTGDTINMSGDFQGAILNIKSTLNKVSQSIGAMPNVDQTDKDGLKILIDQLNKTLQQVPENKTEEAEAVAQSAEHLVKIATEEKPNKTMVQITGEGLKQAAKNLADVMPTVLDIATKIVVATGKLIG